MDFCSYLRELIGRVRSKKKAIIKILDIMEERGKDISQQTIGINHGDDLATAEIVEQMIREKFGVNKFIVTYVDVFLALI